ncbi:cation-chloride cotransporter 1 [Physcomitrium patens]|uniref:Uncharacterized protein n=1 Tax=Physcomitrium patens TaxID=3218 RepID=A0A2K1KG38_PHYPA|nr:cation-chloride cotransporter 1-like [Physcomitrium patens]PNR52742.1 hypothetical protein PHYPA_009117 [Physcomitrium patens]|eukprot:XP_024378755.1 cation-chloride cotransporter 1-like [Physcomitrella patens]
MAEGDERRKSADEGGAEGVEMTTVDLSSPLPPRHAAPESPPGARSQGKENGQGRPSSPSKAIFERSERESKLELFESDPLVNVRGLKSMGGQQHTPQSPQVGEVAVPVGQQRQDPAQQPFFQTKSANLGTLMGVFIPCLQNILGIIFYIRFSWIVGIAGIWHSLVLVSVCCLCTFLTGLSLSAIATNGAMKGGGPYYLIGRALGPEVGVSIGLCFFLGNAVAGSLYVLGAVETFLDAIPAAGIFKQTITITDTLPGAPSGSTVTDVLKTTNIHDLQVYSVILTVLLCLIVFGGVKIINKVAPAFLVPVLLSVALIFIGILAAPRSKDPPGVTGLRWSTLTSNWGSAFQRTNHAGIPTPDGDIYWSFYSLLGLFFPAVTGIMAGSNRSASLKDTQKSIPVGTLSAIGTTTALYLVSVFMFGAVATREQLLTDRLLTATVAWPVAWVVQVGVILSTLGAALQSLTGAPRLLAAIANDDILPVLKYFKAPDGVEPHLSTLATMFICSSCVVIGNLDLITPVITMFFLMCYGGVNLSCLLLELLDAPSWRPRWKYHHWSFSLVGAVLCIVIMFVISWLFTVVSLALASLLYWYVSIKGKGGDWGDGFKSAYFQLALRSLRSLGATQVHPKNWYPIPLIFCKPWGILPNDAPCHPKLADFANCMKKKGRGMSIFMSILEGDYKTRNEDARQAGKLLGTYIQEKKCEGVAEVIVARRLLDGFRGVVQTMGLANLKPNIVCMRYPETWRDEAHREVPNNFYSIINDCSTANKAVVFVKGLDEWPNEYDRQYGTIDLYWIVRDGGLMLLLSQLLRAKECFDNCKIQVFCIAEEETEAEELKADVKKFLYDLRMQADVIVVTMKSWEDHRQENGVGRDGAMEAFSKARKRITVRVEEMKQVCGDSKFEADYSPFNEHQVNKFLYTTLKLNSIILRYSKLAAVVLVSLPPPPPRHPAFCYMEYIDLLVANIPRLLMVRGYRRDVITVFT